MFSLYDTRERALTTIQPARAGQFRMYACGPPVHRPAHLGDLRPYLLSDLIRRNGERHGLSVVSCQAVADIGPLAGDGESDTAAGGTSEADSARSHESAFRADCVSLNIAPPDYVTRTSEAAGLIIGLISALIEAGHAYATDTGAAYFDVRSCPDYGSFSGQPEEVPVSSAEAADTQRRFGTDWPLWTPAPAGSGQTLDAPWGGAGVPSAHAACSAASLQYLGTVIDLHVGDVGQLQQHEEERAQSDCAAGHEVVRHWVHAERVRFEDGEIRLADVAEQGLDPLAARLGLLEYSYREPVELTWAALTASDGTLRDWREQVADWATEPSKPMCADYWARFSGTIDDDMDTPAALSVLRELAADKEIPAGSKFETFAAADRVLGLDLVSLIGQPRPVRR